MCVHFLPIFLFIYFPCFPFMSIILALLFVTFHIPSFLIFFLTFLYAFRSPTLSLSSFLSRFFPVIFFFFYPLRCLTFHTPSLFFFSRFALSRFCLPFLLVFNNYMIRILTLVSSPFIYFYVKLIYSNTTTTYFHQ